jgi:hypothetical protein
MTFGNAKQIAADHAEADKRVGGKCGCAACCIERYGMTRAEHLAYRTTGKWPRRIRVPA